jgi:hypothetical protein
MANVTVTVAVAVPAVNMTLAEYVPGTMAPALMFAWKLTVAVALVAEPVNVPDCVTVSHGGKAPTVKNVLFAPDVAVSVRTSLICAEGELG